MFYKRLKESSIGNDCFLKQRWGRFIRELLRKMWMLIIPKFFKIFYNAGKDPGFCWHYGGLDKTSRNHLLINFDSRPTHVLHNKRICLDKIYSVQTGHEYSNISQFLCILDSKLYSRCRCKVAKQLLKAAFISVLQMCKSSLFT